MKALDYAVENEVHSIRYRSLMENAEAAKIKGEDIKASMIVKRIADLRKVSEKIANKVLGGRSKEKVRWLQTSHC